MSVIRSQPYSRQGRDNWDDIFTKKTLTPTEQVNQIVEQVRTATTADAVWSLREDMRRVTQEMGETDRMKAFRVFNANVPASVIPKE